MPNDIFYRDKITACDREIRRIQGKLNSIAVLRLVLFAALGYDIYVLIRDYSLPLLIAAFGLAAAFIICVNSYYRWKDRRRLWEKLRFVNSNELNVIDGSANGFADGAALLDSEGYLDDLDIFGPRSFFHLLNRTTTIKGREFLSAALRQPLLEPAAILTEQEAVRTLAAQTDLRQAITAHGLLNENTQARPTGDQPGAADFDNAGFRAWLETPAMFHRKPLRLAAMACLILINLIAIYIWLRSNDYTLLLTGVFVSRIVLAACGRYIGRQHQLIDHKKPVLDQYAGILATFNTIDAGHSSILRNLRDRTLTAHQVIRRLSSLANYFDHRTNGLVNLFLNTFLLYDLHCVIALERWKEAYRAGFPGWLEAAGEVERLNSLATFAFNHPDFAYPEPVEAVAAAPEPPAAFPASATGASALFIETTRIAHPLIPAARRIANDCTIGREEKLILVTGSNMSGKTTFLRTLGVNLLMAQCGLPVCAAAFRFTPMELLTSLRIDDSLMDQTSYFMAELKKLQRIVHRLQTGAPALVLIDEILRGTNSEDKTFGSEHFIHRLLQYNCLSLFATHDLTLGALERPGIISNYCFESVIEHDELHFNYQLQRGIARNRNASFLMKKMDII